MDLFLRVYGNKRTTNEEAKQIIDNISGLATLRHNPNDDEEEDKVAIEGDQTEALMYLCRMGYRGKIDRPDSAKDGNRSNADDEEEAAPSLREAESLAQAAAVAASKKEEGSDKKSSRVQAILQDQNMEQKRRFAKALETLSAKAEKRQLIVEDGAVRVLADLSEIPDIAIKQSCAVALSNLSVERNIRQRMIDDSAFSAIITLAGWNNYEVRLSCIRALCNLCCTKGMEPRAVKEGVPLALYQMAQAHASLLPLCLKTLLNISCVPDRFSRAEEVTECVMLLSGFPLSEEEDLLIISIICNLSALRNNQFRIVEDGCMSIIERIIKSTNDKHRIIAAEVLKNLCSDGRTRTKMLDLGIISILLTMSKDPVESVKFSCIQAFFNLSKDTTCREKIVSSNAVVVIIRVSMERINLIDMARIAARTLRSLCIDRNLATKLVKDGIAKALMSLIQNEDSQIKLACAESICALFENKSVVDKLIEQGAVGVLVSLSQSSTDRVTGEWCAFAHYHLSTYPACPASMLRNGILPCLIKLCYASSLRTKQFCAAAMLCITMRKDVDAAGAIPVLVHMLRNDVDRTLKNTCASALYNLAESDTNCDTMLSSGALMPIVNLAQSGHENTMIKCAAILSRLSKHETYYMQFNSVEVIGVIIAISGLDHGITQRRVSIALSNLSQRIELRKIFISINAMTSIISLAARPDEFVRRGCAAFICNLSYDEGSENVLVSTGVVSTLLITALITSDQIETKVICVKALVNLMADDRVHKLMVKEGIIWGLASLAQLENSEIRQMCAQALFTLSVKFARDMLSSNAAIHSILKLISLNDIDVQRESGRVLTNMLLATTDADTAFRKHVVAHISPMAKSRDKEVGELCILCLSLISQSPSCRADIVHSGMLNMIEVTNIFAEPNVGYAYITMFGNIAMDPSMRTYLLDKQAIERFLQICSLKDYNLTFAVLKALYWISCAPENIYCLAEFNTLAVIRLMWQQAQDGSKSELLLFIIAYLYNLTTNSSSAQMIVSQGIVEMLSKAWPLVIDNPKYCHLIFYAVCHLACSRVNTAQMVREGAGQILCFITQCLSHPKYSITHRFPLQGVEKCSAALRNLCTVVGNQQPLAGIGAIECLVALVELREVAEFDNSRTKQVKLNCASALRSMSFNSDIRAQLIKCGALAVILNELKMNAEEAGEIYVINPSLMREMEAESWSNGSRGVQKEDRSPVNEAEPLFVELMAGAHNVELHVKSIAAQQQKYLIKITLEEPPIEIDEMKMADPANAAMAGSIAGDDFRIDPKPMTQPKQECAVNELSDTALDVAAKLAADAKAVLSSGGSLMIGTLLVANEPTEEEQLSEEFIETDRLSEPDAVKRSRQGRHSAMDGEDQANRINLRSGAILRDDIVGEALAAMNTRLPEIKRDSKGALGPGGRSDSDSSGLPSLTNPADANKRIKKRVPRSTNKEFDKLVTLINRSRGSDTDIDAVLKKWKTIPKG